jgi:hypothetical protein
MSGHDQPRPQDDPRRPAHDPDRQPDVPHHHPDQTAHGPHDAAASDAAPAGAPGAERRPGVHPEADRASRTKPAIAGAVALGVVALLVYLAVGAGILGG